MSDKKEKAKYYVPLEPEGICLFGPRIDMFLMAGCLIAMGGMLYANKDGNVFSYSGGQLPQLHEAFGTAGKGRCVVHGHKREIMFFEKETTLANCFEGARKLLIPDKMEYASFGLTGADGKSVAYGTCSMNKNVPQGYCQVEVPGAGKPDDVTYKINL